MSDETIFKQGDPPGPLYLIESGRVRLWAAEGGRRKHVTQLGRGEGIGEMSVFRRLPRALGAETLTPCSLLALSAETFQRLLDTLPEFRAEMEARIRMYSYKDVAQVPAGVDQECCRPARRPRSRSATRRSISRIARPRRPTWRRSRPTAASSSGRVASAACP